LLFGNSSVMINTSSSDFTSSIIISISVVLPRRLGIGKSVSAENTIVRRTTEQINP
jgi:hypothetical protein